jgi:hypothetical protein
MPTVKMSRKGDGFVSNEQITVDPSEVEKYKTQGFMEDTPAVAPPSTQMPVVENPLGIVTPPSAMDSSQLSPSGQHIAPPPPPPQPAQPVVPASMPSMAPGAMIKTGEQVQTTRLAPQDRAALQVATQEQINAEKAKSEASIATESAMKKITGDNLQAYQAAVGDLDSRRKVMSEDELKAQSTFMNDYANRLAQFEKTPVPQRQSWWDASSTGNKIASGIAAILGLVAMSKTGDAAPLNLLLKKMDDTVSADLESQKARYLSEKDKLAGRKEFNDIRVKNFRDSIGAIEAKRAIVVDETLKKAELALAQNKNLDDAQKAKMLADFQAKAAEIKVNGIKDAATKTTAGSTYQLSQPGTGKVSALDQEKLIGEIKKNAGLERPDSPLRVYIDNKQSLGRVNAMLDPKNPNRDTDRLSAAIELGNFIAKGLQQGSFQASMVETIFPGTLAQSVESRANYVMGKAQGQVTDSQILAMRQFLKNKVEQNKGLEVELSLAKRAAIEQGIDPNRIEATMSPDGNEITSFKPTK